MVCFSVHWSHWLGEQWCTDKPCDGNSAANVKSLALHVVGKPVVFLCVLPQIRHADSANASLDTGLHLSSKTKNAIFPVVARKVWLAPHLTSLPYISCWYFGHRLSHHGAFSRLTSCTSKIQLQMIDFFFFLNNNAYNIFNPHVSKLLLKSM